ncbi:MAG: hypothetical protein C0490_11790 [Marivirga sp.]|nr:hypothetical protein [Marivirga sp.]
MQPPIIKTMNANGKTKNSKVRPVTPRSRVDRKSKHRTPMTSRVKNDINNSIKRLRFEDKKIPTLRKRGIGSI